MDLRALLYPLGFIATFIFTARFLLQWFESEIKGKSVVSPSFWYVSLMGNLILCLHTFIQVQYPFCLIQGLNAILAWRNLDLLKSRRASMSLTISLLIGAAILITSAFVIQGFLSFGFVDWIRTPTLPWSEESGTPISLSWHVLGFLGATIFALRFWIQWWYAEKRGISFISANFWWTSLIGASLALVYFFHMKDWVNILGYGLGIIPYARNLVLLKAKT